MRDQEKTIGSFDIGIVGGGMVGAVLALLLEKVLPAFHIAIIDAESLEPKSLAPSLPSFDARSTALSPSSVRVIQQLGLWSQLLDYATPIESIHVSDRGRLGMATFDRDDNSGEPLGFVVENLGFGNVLLEALARAKRVTCFSKSTVESLAFSSRTAQFCLDNARRVDARLAVIADGAHSRLRNQLGISCARHDYQQHAVVANIFSEKAHGGRAYERFTQDGPLALLPLGRNANSHQSTIVWTFPTEQLEQVKLWQEQEFLHKLQQCFGFRLGRFTRVTARHFYPLERIVAREQVRSRMVLMGNAAHFLHPVAGQGFNLALRDALRLVESLREANDAQQDPGLLPVLQRYIDAQLPDQHVTMALSQAFIQFFRRIDRPSVLLRTLGFIGLETNSLAREQFIRQLSGRGQPEARIL